MVGCSPSGVIIPTTEEAKIKIVINEYALALSNHNWNKARGYCVYGSEPYYAISQTESLINNLSLYCNLITFNYIINIQNVSVSGNYATVYGYSYKLVTACGYYDTYEKYSTYHLQKVGNSWKIYKVS